MGSKEAEVMSGGDIKDSELRRYHSDQVTCLPPGDPGRNLYLFAPEYFETASDDFNGGQGPARWSSESKAANDRSHIRSAQAGRSGTHGQT